MKISKAVYTATIVACWWAGAVKHKKSKKSNLKLSGNRQTDRQDDLQSRVARD